MKRKVLPARLCMEMKEKTFLQGIVWKCEGTGLLTKQCWNPALCSWCRHPCCFRSGSSTCVDSGEYKINKWLKGRISLQIGSITPCLSDSFKAEGWSVMGFVLHYNAFAGYFQALVKIAWFSVKRFFSYSQSSGLKPRRFIFPEWARSVLFTP